MIFAEGAFRLAWNKIERAVRAEGHVASWRCASWIANADVTNGTKRTSDLSDLHRPVQTSRPMHWNASCGMSIQIRRNATEALQLLHWQRILRTINVGAHHRPQRFAAGVDQLLVPITKTLQDAR